MFAKRTEELIHEIHQSGDIFTYLANNHDQLLSLSAHEFLSQMREQKGLSRREIVKACGFDQVYAYQILAGIKNGGRDKLLCLALAMHLDEWQTGTLLYLSGEARLYARSRRDAVILFAIRRQLDVYAADDLLDQSGEKTLSNANA